MLTPITLTIVFLSAQMDSQISKNSNTLEHIYQLGPQEILEKDPILKAAVDAFERELGKMITTAAVKTRVVQRTVYRPVEQRYGLFGRKCRIVYVPQIVQTQEQYQETIRTLQPATLLATVANDEAGRGDASADFRESPQSLEALAKRIRTQLRQFATTNGLSVRVQDFTPTPGSGPDNAVLVEPGDQIRYSRIVGLADLAQDVKQRLDDKQVAYSIIARIDELNDNRIVRLIVRVAFDSSAGPMTISLTDASAAAQLLADRLQKELAPSDL